MKPIRRHLTYANVLATLALFLSVSGTAYAAVVLTGKNVKDSTLTGVDVKNGSLTTADLAATAVAQLKGKDGAKGAAGAKGDPGPKGDTGTPGAPGTPAKVVASFASEDTDAYRSPSGSTGNPDGENWYTYDKDGTPGADAISTNAAPELDFGPFANIQFLVGLTDGPAPGGYLNVNFDSAINAVGSVAVLHRGSVHTRVECQLWVVDVDTSSQYGMGDPVYVSSNTPNEIVTVSLVGTKNMSVPTGQTKRYDTQVRCRDADRTTQNADKWEYVRGNVTAFAASAD